MTNPTYSVERIKADGQPTMIKITIGDQSLLLSEQDAYDWSETIQEQASLTAYEGHINAALDGWGSDNWSDGGTC